MLFFESYIRLYLKKNKIEPQLLKYGTPEKDRRGFKRVKKTSEYYTRIFFSWKYERGKINNAFPDRKRRIFVPLCFFNFFILILIPNFQE